MRPPRALPQNGASREPGFRGRVATTSHATHALRALLIASISLGEVGLAAAVPSKAALFDVQFAWGSAAALTVDDQAHPRELARPPGEKRALRPPLHRSARGAGQPVPPPQSD